MTRLVWADAETTGIRPDRGAEVWELALIVRDVEVLTADYEVRKAADDEYVWHFRPHGPMDAMALRIGGYYERCEVKDDPPGVGRVIASPRIGDWDPAGSPVSGGATAGRIATLLNGAHLIAANPHFDAAHIGALLEAHGECLTADYHYTDLGSLVRGWAHGSFTNPIVPFPLKLADAARLAGLSPDDYDTHTALGDARLGRDIYDAVTGGAS